MSRIVRSYTAIYILTITQSLPYGKAMVKNVPICRDHYNLGNGKRIRQPTALSSTIWRSVSWWYRPDGYTHSIHGVTSVSYSTEAADRPTYHEQCNTALTLDHISSKIESVILTYRYFIIV